MVKGQSRFSSEVERREYYRQYHQRRRDEGLDRDRCPDCNGWKHQDAARCRGCHAVYRTGQPHPHGSTRPKSPAVCACPCCDVEMRSVAWHGYEFMRCPTCGLETTSGELRRIASEANLDEVAA